MTEDHMSYLSKLNTVPLKKRQGMSPVEVRRTKLVAKLEEQLAMASAAAEGRSFAVTKSAWGKDAEGNRVRIQRDKKLTAWWWQDGGAISLVVRYGAKPLELAKGKRAVSVPNIAALPEVILTLISAAQSGELDAAIEAVAGTSKVRPGKA